MVRLQGKKVKHNRASPELPIEASMIEPSASQQGTDSVVPHKGSTRKQESKPPGRQAISLRSRADALYRNTVEKTQASSCIAQANPKQKSISPPKEHTSSQAENLSMWASLYNSGFQSDETVREFLSRRSIEPCFKSPTCKPVRDYGLRNGLRADSYFHGRQDASEQTLSSPGEPEALRPAQRFVQEPSDHGVKSLCAQSARGDTPLDAMLTQGSRVEKFENKTSRPSQRTKSRLVKGLRAGVTDQVHSSNDTEMRSNGGSEQENFRHEDDPELSNQKAFQSSLQGAPQKTSVGNTAKTKNGIESRAQPCYRLSRVSKPLDGEKGSFTFSKIPKCKLLPHYSIKIGESPLNEYDSEHSKDFKIGCMRKTPYSRGSTPELCEAQAQDDQTIGNGSSHKRRAEDIFRCTIPFSPHHSSLSNKKAREADANHVKAKLVSQRSSVHTSRNLQEEEIPKTPICVPSSSAEGLEPLVPMAVVPASTAIPPNIPLHHPKPMIPPVGASVTEYTGYEGVPGRFSLVKEGYVWHSRSGWLMHPSFYDSEFPLCRMNQICRHTRDCHEIRKRMAAMACIKDGVSFRESEYVWSVSRSCIQRLVIAYNRKVSLDFLLTPTKWGLGHREIQNGYAYARESAEIQVGVLNRHEQSAVDTPELDK